MKVLLISGKAQHGKDTTANILKEKLVQQNKKVLITHYADLLKYICQTFFGWNGVKDNNGRSILQYVGTEIIRKQKPDFWVNFIHEILHLFKDKWDYVIIPDVRFPNEIELMKNDTLYDSYSIRVYRDNFDNGLSTKQKNHKSEIALDNHEFDYYINNSETIDDLYNQIDKFIKKIEVAKFEY